MGWSDGLSTPSREIVLTRSSTVAAVYRVEYYVSVTSPYGETLGSGWYKEGSRATVSVQPTAVGFGIKQIFDRWEDEEGNFVSNSPTLTIVVDRPIELRAVWRTDYTELVLLVMIAGVGVALAIFAKKLSRRPPRLRK